MDVGAAFRGSAVEARARDVSKRYEPFRITNVWKKVAYRRRLVTTRTIVMHSARGTEWAVLQVKVVSKASYSKWSYQAKEWRDSFEHWRRRR